MGFRVLEGIMGRKDFWKLQRIMGETKDCGNVQFMCGGLMSTTKDHGKKGMLETTWDHGKDKGIV